MRVSDVGENRPESAEWKDRVEEVEDVEERRGGVFVDQVGGVGVGAAGGFTRSGRVLGPSDLNDMTAQLGAGGS
jgi:hypothetical protein